MGILIEFCLPRVFKLDLVSLFIRVVCFVTVFIFVPFIDKVIFSFPYCFPIYIIKLIFNSIASKKIIAQECIVLVCTVALRMSMVEANISYHGFLQSSFIFCTLKVLS